MTMKMYSCQRFTDKGLRPEKLIFKRWNCLRVHPCASPCGFIQRKALLRWGLKPRQALMHGLSLQELHGVSSVCTGHC